MPEDLVQTYGYVDSDIPSTPDVEHNRSWWYHQTFTLPYNCYYTRGCELRAFTPVHQPDNKKTYKDIRFSIQLGGQITVIQSSDFSFSWARAIQAINDAGWFGSKGTKCSINLTVFVNNGEVPQDVRDGNTPPWTWEEINDPNEGIRAYVYATYKG